ncbi:MAG TPA: hypothetical protein VK831_03135 [Candidatus Deferrimicrobiaceae bacterium]|nr:hypothetical protein [Candidatus Deferrimicrobiaceae bacterium]
MIELELPCCGTSARLDEDAGEVRCDGCGVVAALAPDPEPVAASRTRSRDAGIGIPNALAA